MLIDTDVLIWFLRGRESARAALDAVEGARLSAVTYMELVQDMRDKEELRLLRRTMRDRGWAILPIDENISQRATVYVESHAPSHGLQLADALIAASAVESGSPLMTANVKHYRFITEVVLVRYCP